MLTPYGCRPLTPTPAGAGPLTRAVRTPEARRLRLAAGSRPIVRMAARGRQIACMTAENPEAERSPCGGRHLALGSQSWKGGELPERGSGIACHAV